MGTPEISASADPIRSPRDTAPVLVIGYGNPWFADDGVGAAVVSALAELGLERWAELHVCHQLLPELAIEFARARRVILIDADASLPPGELRVRRVRPTAETACGHRWSAASVLSIASGLCSSSSVDRRVAQVRAYTIGAESLEPVEGLSPRVAASARRLVNHLSRKLTPPDAVRLCSPHAPS